MSKPVAVIDPITGRRSFTKHPERLIRRGHAAQHGAELRVTPAGLQARIDAADAELEFKRNHGERVYWNGADPNRDATHLPGTASVFPRQGDRLSS